MSDTRGETHAPKRHAADNSSPLHHIGILQVVLDYVDPLEHIFLSTVSKGFRACYLNVPVYEGAYEDEHGKDVAITLKHDMTACSAVLGGSLSRVRLAVELGFAMDVKHWRLQRIAGSCADIETLEQLNTLYGMPFTEHTGRGAAVVGAVSKLRWLLDEQQCPQAADICMYGVFASTTDMLKFLKQRGSAFTADLCTAAAQSRCAATILQYLHSEGVPFEPSTMITAISYQKLPLLQWLYEHGCPLSKAAAMTAAELEDLSKLSWLHSVACPCDYNFLCLAAASNGAIALLQWIKDNGVVNWSPAALSGSLNVAGVNQQLEAAQVCREHLCLHAVRLQHCVVTMCAAVY
jgi:hypothetical protein